MESQTEIKAVIFDLDGVLLDTWHVAELAFANAYHETVGTGEPPLEAFRSYQGQGFSQILHLLGLPNAMHQIFVRESRRLVPETRIYTDIPAVLEALRSRSIRLAVATGKDGFRAREILEFHKMSRYFSLIVGSDDVSRGKPAPDMLHRILNYFNIEPQGAIFVGDSVADLQAGRNAGTGTVAALWGEGDHQCLRAEQPDHEIAAPKDLLAYRGLATAELEAA